MVQKAYWAQLNPLPKLTHQKSFISSGMISKIMFLPPSASSGRRKTSLMWPSPVRTISRWRLTSSSWQLQVHSSKISWREIRIPHPLIYMRGLKLEDLLAIINILYFGEANAFQENLDTFLVLAEEQRPKGLTGSGNSGKGKEPPKNKENFETAPIKRENAKQNPVPSISDPNKQKHCHCHREKFNWCKISRSWWLDQINDDHDWCNNCHWPG